MPRIPIQSLTRFLGGGGLRLPSPVRGPALRRPTSDRPVFAPGLAPAPIAIERLVPRFAVPPPAPALGQPASPAPLEPDDTAAPAPARRPRMSVLLGG